MAFLLFFLASSSFVQAATGISTCQELQDMNNDLDADYELTGDIDCSATSSWNSGAGFEPIGSTATPFSGNFDGNNYVITGLTINRPTEDEIGLFGGASLGTISDVGMTGGSIIGRAYVGGLVGNTDANLISNCYNTGTVSGTGSVLYLGGLVGMFSGTMTNSYTTGNVTNSSGTLVGGIAGWSDGEITGSYSSGNVTGATNVGGVTGMNDGTITSSHATGTITATGSNAGGMVGANSGTISQSYASGDVSAASASQVGGAVGFLDGGTLQNSYPFGDVTGNSSVGGLVGNSDTGTITNGYSIGAVSGNSSVGGLIGSDAGGTTITSSYWDTETSSQASSAGGTGKTTAQMKQEATFSGWDFSTTPIWAIVEDTSYPYLSAEPGIAIVETSAITSVAESGTTDTFTVALDFDPPTSNVVLSISSGDTGEVTVSPSTLTFTTVNWATAQTVTVTGVDDKIDDNNQSTTITLSITDASSDDTYDDVADETVTVITTDDDGATSGSGVLYGCKDPAASNYISRFVRHNQSLCKYNSSNSPTSAPAQFMVLTRLLTLGMKGSDVRELQIRLNKLGFIVAKTGVGSPGHENGSFGPKTLDAVKRFQKANNLFPDGIVGKKTLGELRKASN